MASTGAPPPPPHGEDPSDDPLAPEEAAPPEAVRPDADARIGLDRILPELIRRGFEAGRGPLKGVSESIFPKELASHVVSQLVDIRSGVVKAVAQEVGRFLREADIASEVRKVLTGLDIDAQVKLRFTAREDGSLKPEAEVRLGSEPPPPGEKPKDKDKKKK